MPECRLWPSTPPSGLPEHGQRHARRRPGRARPSLSRCFGDDEPEKEIHHFSDAHEAEHDEPEAHEGRIQAEELGQSPAHTSEEAV